MSDLAYGKTEQAIDLHQNFLELDGVRGLAVSLVFFHHCFPDKAVQGRFLWPFSMSGWVGVSLFFALSGFLITRILLGSSDKPGRYAIFYGKRTLRIFPLYFFVLGLFTLTALLLPAARGLTEGLAPALYYWTYTFNVYLTVHNGWPSNELFNHFWSLSVEEQFYLIWPFIVFNTPRARLPKVMGAICALSFLARLVFVGAGLGGVPAYTNTLTRMDGFALGGLAAYAHCFWSREKLLKPTRRVFWISGLIILAYGWMRGGIYSYARTTQLVIGPTITLFFACMIYLGINGGDAFQPMRRAFRWPAMRFLGKYSYGIYVYHCLIWIVWKERVPLSATGPWGRTVVMAILTLLVSVLSFHLLENPFLRYKEALVAYLGGKGKSVPTEESVR